VPFLHHGSPQITGYGPEEFTDDLWGSMVQERHLLDELAPFSLQDAIQQVRSGNIPIWKCEHCIKARDGKIRWVFEAAVDLRDEQGMAYGSVGLYQDITERKQSEELLKYERYLLQIFLDNIPDTVYFKDRDSKFVRVNSAQARFLGLDSPADAIGRTDLDFQPPEMAKMFLEEERRMVETGEEIINRIESNPTVDGRSRWLSATKVPVKDATGQVVGIIGISRDITSQKLAEEYEQNRGALLEKVISLGQEVTKVQDLQTTLKKIWDGVRYNLDFDRTGIYLYEDSSNTMNGTFGTNFQGEMTEEWDSHISLDRETTESKAFLQTLSGPEGLYRTQSYDTEHGIQDGHIMQGVKDFASVVARIGDKPVAVICVDQVISGRVISNEQLEALRLFAGYAGLAIENARLHSTLEAELEQQKQAEEREVLRRTILEKVVRLGKSVTEVADIRTTLERIWHGVHDDLEFDRLAIFLYNTNDMSIDDTFGTNNQGEMVDEWHIRFPFSEAAIFMRVLERPDGLYFTHNYDVENNIPEENEMHGVKEYAAVAAWAGNKPVAVICVDHFITGRPISEEQLEALKLFAGYAGLAIENSRLNDALQAELNQRQTLIDELEAKNAELERFTYTVSHDLKSPLVTITGFLGFLEQDALSGNIEQIKKGVSRISNAAQKMQALLNDLLELSRVGRLMNPPEDIPFEEIVHEAIDRVHGRIDEIDAVVETRGKLPVVHVDKVRMVEVMQNLLDNALKYSIPGVTPRIEVGTNNINENGWSVFYVRDNGIGIDPQYHERIFGLFNKLDNKTEGTGIGLSLVKRIIEVHNGKIWVESQIGQGSTFFFTLPTPHPKE
jgi:PAS domain S-box-containing protein